MMTSIGWVSCGGYDVGYVWYMLYVNYADAVVGLADYTNHVPRLVSKRKNK